MQGNVRHRVRKQKKANTQEMNSNNDFWVITLYHLLINDYVIEEILSGDDMTTGKVESNRFIYLEKVKDAILIVK